MGLKFKDITDWKPSSISIVDSPSHPLAVFEVYENDEEFIKKYSPIEVDNLSNEEKIVEETENVTMSSSFFERLIGGLISKSEPVEEPPENHPVKEEEEYVDKMDKILEKIEAVEEKVNSIESSFDERIKKLENPEEPKKEEDEEDETVADDDKTKTMVKKSEKEEDEEEEPDETVVDENKTKTMVKKSKEIDPDLSNTSAGSEMTFMERIGRSEDGMKW